MVAYTNALSNGPIPDPIRPSLPPKLGFATPNKNCNLSFGEMSAVRGIICMEDFFIRNSPMLFRMVPSRNLYGLPFLKIGARAQFMLNLARCYRLRGYGVTQAAVLYVCGDN